MKTLAASNRHLNTTSARKASVERNVRSSSAIEGVSGKVFLNAAAGQWPTRSAVEPNRTVVKKRHPKK